MTLSFKRYALLLALLVGVIYLLLGVLGYRQYQAARQGMEMVERLAADIEVRNALEKVSHSLRKGAETLADWDELFQQLANPLYFSYWYSHRILDGSGLDDRFSSLMLYRPNGEALGVISDNPLPRKIDPAHLEELYEPDGDDARLTIILPLRRDGGNQVAGYLAVQAPLLPNLLRQYSFNRIDTHSLRIALPAPTHDLKQVMAAVAYRLLPNPGIDAMDELVLHNIFLLGGAVLISTLVLLFLFTWHVGRMVRKIPVLVKTLREKGVEPAQDLLQRPEHFRIRELEMAEQSLLEYHTELSSANASLDEKNQELWSLAHRDVLTGAQNRRAFDAYWATLQSMNERHPRFLRLMLVDVNRFKAINDTYGHDVGDAVLKAVVQCLHRAVRRDEQLFRIGGDEFVCVLLDCDDQQAMLVASRCEHEVASYPFSEELDIREPVRLSIGISPATKDRGVQAKTLMRQADVAMYHSKRPASGSICIYRESLESQAGTVFSSSVNEAVYRVIEQGEGLVLHYQPVRHLKDREIGYYEALLRIDAGDELIYPGEIMPVIESRHLEKELDQAVLDRILKDLYSNVIPVGRGVSINLSAASIVDDGILARMEPFRPFLTDFRVVLEVTETVLITQIEVANRHIMQLRSVGFEVALDDFGSGYSSLSYLTRMPVDIVKFDIALVRALDDEIHRRLVEHLLEFITSAGLITVAEGVEDETSLERVREIGFDCVQGYYWGRPQELTPIPRITARTE